MERHYGKPELAAQVAAALSREFETGHRWSVAELARLDQFHTRGLAATRDLAAAAGVSRDTRVLDAGCGLGGPARYLAATYGCTVTGIDLSLPFIKAARLITSRSQCAERVTFAAADALALPFLPASFDLVWMQHVAMNVENRAALYAQCARVLREGGRLALYDVVSGHGEFAYPVPWARDATASFVCTEEETRALLEAAGFAVVSWNLETELALASFASAPPAQGAPGLDLTLAMGADFPMLAANLARNLRSGAAGILSAVVERR
jgi:SAM-dependent methyltransferase